MSRDCSDRITTHFGACARDLTPSSRRHAAQVFYAPVRSDPEVTRICSSILSKTELQRADRFATQDLRDLFIQRRAFRRFCGARVLGASKPLAQIAFNETENGRPYLRDLPDIWFSFSSCRLGFAGAWSSTHGIGVDLEDITRPVETAELAQQFFSATEARVVEAVSGLKRQQTFFQFWCLKEAALKSIGEGLPLGLDAFEFELVPKLRVVHVPPGHGRPERFSAHLIEETELCTAIVIRSEWGLE
jgi:phosphopantetheine--protein transferase-like protein